MGINTADNLSLGSLFVHLFKSLFFILFFFFSFMGRMNFPVLLGLLLSAVMVTGRGIKDHIASERKHHADAAAAEPEKAEEAIVEAVDGTAQFERQDQDLTTQPREVFCREMCKFCKDSDAVTYADKRLCSGQCLGDERRGQRPGSRAYNNCLAIYAARP